MIYWDGGGTLVQLVRPGFCCNTDIARPSLISYKLYKTYPVCLYSEGEVPKEEHQKVEGWPGLSRIKKNKVTGTISLFITNKQDLIFWLLL